MVYFDQILHTNACQHYGQGFAEHHFSRLCLVSDSHGIFGSNFAYLFILTLFNNCYAKWSQDFGEHHFLPVEGL